MPNMHMLAPTFKRSNFSRTEAMPSPGRCSKMPQSCARNSSAALWEALCARTSSALTLSSTLRRPTRRLWPRRSQKGRCLIQTSDQRQIAETTRNAWVAKNAQACPDLQAIQLLTNRSHPVARPLLHHAAKLRQEQLCSALGGTCART